MKKIFLFLLLFFSYINIFGQKMPVHLLSPQSLNEDYEILLQHLEKYHPDKYLYTDSIAFDAIQQQIKKELNQPMLEIDFYKKILPLIVAIRNNHTSLYSSKNYLDLFKKHAKRFPLGLYYRKDTLFLFRDASIENNIGLGKVITKINGQNALQLVKKMAQLRPTDGYNTTSAMLQVSRSFNHHYALLYGTPNHFDVTYIDEDGKEKTIQLQSITLPKTMQTLKERYPIYRLPKQVEPHLKIISTNSTAILTIPTFQPKNELKFMLSLRKMFKKIKKENIKNLVIDVRGNGGGYPESVYCLLSYLVEEKIKTTQLAYALVENLVDPNHFKKDGFYKHFNRKKLKKQGDYYHTNDAKRAIIRPKKQPFKGNLYILLDEKSASASAEFLGLAKTYCQATFIGRESGSNPITQVATDIVTLILPHSLLNVRFPLIKTELNVNFKNDGHGLIPDHEIIPTIDQILEEKDMDLEKAMELINKNK